MRCQGWLILLCTLLFGCTGKHKPPADTLVVALGSEPSTLDPRYATDANGMRIGGLIFEPLVRTGPGFQPEGIAAERWEYRDHTYTFFLRPNLTFHNGRAVTPADIEYSFAFYRSSKSPFASNLTRIKDVVAREEDGRLVVRLKVENQSDTFLIADLPGVKILPKEESQSPDFTRKLTGTGPFAYEKTDINEIRLKSVRANVPYLRFKIVRDDFTRYQKLLKGEVDFVQADMPTDKVAEFEKRPDQFQVTRYPGLTMTYLLFNFKDPVLKDLKVRKALAASLDRPEIIQYKMNGLAQEATSVLTPNNPYFNGTLKNAALDLTGAAKAIADLGYKGRTLILKTSNSPQAIDNGKVLANQLSRSGVNVDLESYEWGTFYGDVKRGNFQMATMRWVGTADPSIYKLAFHSSEAPPGRNRGSYNNAEVDRLLDQAEKEESVEKRKKLFMRIQAIVHEELAILPLWYDEQVAIARKNVLNFKPSLTSDFSPLAKVTKTEP